MRVAVSAAGPSLDAQVDPRFGRCQFFVIVDTDTMKSEALANTGESAMSGAGIQAAQAVADKGVGAVITGNIGPNAYQVLSSAGIRIFAGVFGTVREAVEKFKSGQLAEAQSPGPGGMGRGLGAAGGMGIRRGMGRGRGRGMGRGGAMRGTQAQWPTSARQTPSVITPSTEDEIASLQTRIEDLEKQLEQLKMRLAELKGS